MAPFGASRAGLMSTRVDAIPDSEAYYIASEIDANDSETISEVPDLTGNGYDLTPSDGTGSTTATFVESESDINNESAVQFNDNGGLGSSTPTLSLPFSVITVQKIEGTNNEELWGNTQSGDGLEVRADYTQTNSFRIVDETTSFKEYWRGVSVFQDWAVWTHVFPTSGDTKTYFNGNEVTDIESNGLPGNDLGGFQLGSSERSASHFDGKWAESGLFDEELSDSQRQDIENDLIDKYGIDSTKP